MTDQQLMALATQHNVVCISGNHRLAAMKTRHAELLQSAIYGKVDTVVLVTRDDSQCLENTLLYAAYLNSSENVTLRPSLLNQIDNLRGVVMRSTKGKDPMSFKSLAEMGLDRQNIQKNFMIAHAYGEGTFAQLFVVATYPNELFELIRDEIEKGRVSKKGGKTMEVKSLGALVHLGALWKGIGDADAEIG